MLLFHTDYSIDVQLKQSPLSFEQKRDISLHITQLIIDLHKNQQYLGYVHPKFFKQLNDTYLLKIVPLSEVEEYQFSAPELFHFLKNIKNPRTDLYSLGVFLYYLYEGKVPITPNENQNWGEAHLNNIIMPLSLIDTRLNTIILKLLSKNPSHRYQSATAVLVDLKLVFFSDENDSLEKIGQIDNILDYAHNFQYPRQLKVTTTYNTFLHTKHNVTSILTITGQEQSIRSDCLNQFMDLVEEASYQTYLINTCIWDNQTNPFLKTIINYYLCTIATYTSSEVDSFFDEVKKKKMLNITYLRIIFSRFDSLITTLSMKQNFNWEQEGKIENLSYEHEKSMLTQFVKLLHVYIKRPVLLFIDGEQALTQFQLNQMLEILSELSPLCHVVVTCWDEKLEVEAQCAVHVAQLYLAPLSFEEVKSILTSILKQDSEQVRILAQSFLYYSKGYLNKYKSLFIQWHNENHIRFDVDSYRWVWSIELIQNQNFTEELLTFMKDQFDRLSEQVREIIAVAALISGRVNALLLTEVYGGDSLNIYDAMKQAEKIGIVYYDEKDSQFELNEYVFLTDELRSYIQRFLSEDVINWHYKIATVVKQRYSYSLWNSTYLYMYHFTKAHTCLNEQDLISHVYNNLELGLTRFESKDYTEAKFYFGTGIMLCEYYDQNFEMYFDKFLLYLGISEHVIGNEKDANYYLTRINPERLSLNDKRKYYMWRMEINVFNNGDLALEYGKEALKLYDWEVKHNVNPIVLLFEVISTQKFLRKYKSGKLHTKSNTSEEFTMLCRIIYSISNPLGTKNIVDLIYLYTKFFKKYLVEGINDDLAISISLYEILIQRGLPLIYKLFPTDSSDLVLSKVKNSSFYFYVLRAVLSQVDRQDEVYSYLSLALTQSIKSDDYRSFNLILMTLIVAYNEDMHKLKDVITRIEKKGHISVDMNMQELIDEFTSYYEANIDETHLLDYVFEQYDINKNHINYISMNRMEMSYIAQEYERVLFWYSLAEQTMISINWIQNRKILIYKYLAFAELYYSEKDEYKKREYKQAIHSFLRKMKSWTGYIGQNSSLYYLMWAEYEAIKGNYFNAQNYYEKGIKRARQEKNTKYEAILLERLAQLLDRLDSETGKIIALTDAITAYSNYGIQSKVTTLSRLIRKIEQPNIVETTMPEISKRVEHSSSQSMEKIIEQSEHHLSKIYGMKGHWSNQVFLDSFLSLACRQVTSDYGLLVKVDQGNINILSQYGNFEYEREKGQIDTILNYCTNTLQVYMYEQSKLNTFEQPFKSVMGIPIRTIQRNDLYILVLTSQYFENLFSNQEKVVMELFLSRFVFLAEQAQVTSKQITSYLQTSVQTAVFTTLLDPLTERELDVLREIVNGYTNDEISENLDIKVATVKTHINNIYSKLGVRRRAQAIIKAKEMNLV